MARRQRPEAKRSGPQVSARSPLLPFYLILGMVAVAGVGVLLYQSVGRPAPVVSPIAIDIPEEELARAPGIARGPVDAPVVIFEFADFQCPACAQFATFYAPLIKERFVDPGHVRYVYYDFPLRHHQHAFLASRAGRCADEQDLFWEYHDVLYARQPRWSAASDATPLFVEYADDVGADRRSFESCLRSDRYALEVTQNLQLGLSLGVGGTPTLFINGRLLPSIPTYSQLEELIRQELGAPGAAAPVAAPDQTGRETPGIP